jgi:hypothetical protein
MILTPDALMTWFISRLRTISTAELFGCLTRVLAELLKLVELMCGLDAKFSKISIRSTILEPGSVFQEIIEIRSRLQQNSKVRLAKWEPEKPANWQSNSNLQQSQRRQMFAQALGSSLESDLPRDSSVQQ